MVDFSFKLISAIVATMLVTSCTGKSSQRTQHEGPLRTDYGPNLNNEQAKDAVQKAYATSGKAEQIISDSSSSIKVILEVVAELADTVLNTSIVSQPEMSSRADFKSVLATLNRGLVRAIAQDLNAVRASGLLKRYQDVLLQGCGKELAQCYNLPLFRDHLTARILTTIALELEPSIVSDRQARRKTIGADELSVINTRYSNNVSDFYRLLFAAYDVSTGTPADQLNMSYVRLSQDYYEMLKLQRAVNQDPAMESRIGESQRRHNQNFNIALTQVRDRFKSTAQRAEYCKFVVDANPLSFEVTKSTDFDRRTLRFFVTEFIDCSTQGKDNKTLENKVHERLKVETDQFTAQRAKDLEMESANPDVLLKVKDIGIGYVMAELREITKIAVNLGVDFNIQTDPVAMFVIDQLFYEKIDQTMARAYWEKIRNLDEGKILKYIRNYARAQMAYELKVTLQNYGKILAQEFKKRGGLGTGYFDDVIKRVNSQSQLGWGELKRRETFLHDFATQVFDQKLNRPIVEDGLKNAKVEYIKLKEELNSLDEHLGISLLTPMNLALYYYMAKSQGTIKIFVPWWKSANQYFQINASSALTIFLTSEQPAYQFFRLARPVYALDRLNKLHALDLAIRGGVFELLPFDLIDIDKKDRPFDAKQIEANNQFLFFRQVFKDVLGAYETMFQAQITRLDSIEKNRNFSERFLNACQDPLGAQVSMDLQSLRAGTLLEEKQLTDAVRELYDTGSFMGSWRSTRDSVKNYIKVLTSRSSLGSEKILKEFAQYEQMERKFYQRLFSLDRKLVDQRRDCLLTLHQADYYRRDVIYKANLEYYRNVHAAMTFLKLVDGQPNDVALNSAESLIGQWLSTNSKNRDVADRMQRLIATIKSVGLSALQAESIEIALNKILSVHNNQQAPFLSSNSELGYFINGLPSLQSSNIQMKSLNYFSKDSFAQGRWDNIVRVRRQLQTTWVTANEANSLLGTNYSNDFIVGRNIDIPLGSFGELENNGIYIDNQVKRVSFTIDQADFVKRSMVQFAGAEGNGGNQSISWGDTYGRGLSLFLNRFSWLMEISEFGTIEIQDADDNNCEKDEWDNPIATHDIYGNAIVAITERNKDCKAVRVTPKIIIDTFVQLGQFAHLKPFDKEMLLWTDRYGKHNDLVTRFFGYLNEPSATKWTWFDEFYRKFLVTVTRYQANASGGIERISVETLRGRDEFDAFHDSWLLNVRSARHLFSLSPEPTQIERNAIRKQLIDHIQTIGNYEASIADLENHKVDLGIIEFERVTAPRSDEVYNDGIWRHIPVKLRAANSSRPGTPIYLEDNNKTKAWYASYLETFFVKETVCEAVPKATDPDAAILGAARATIINEKASCLERFKAWDNWRKL